MNPFNTHAKRLTAPLVAGLFTLLASAGHAADAPAWKYVRVYQQSGTELSDFDRHDEEFGAAVQKAGALGVPDLTSAWLRSHTSGETQIWEAQRELSYVPSRADAWEQPFRIVRVFYLKRDKEKDFVDTIKTLNEIDRDAGITAPRLVLKLKVGPNGPAMALVVPAKDDVDYYTGYAKRTQLRQNTPKGKEIYQTLEQCRRSAEVHQVTVQPEFSKK